MSRRRHRRARLVWLTLFALLLQQFALAAHACEIGFAASGMAAPDTHCARDAGHDPAPADPLCAKHCTPDRVTNADTVSAKLPPMLLPPDDFRLAAVSSMRTPHAWPTAAHAAGPPPSLRFRVLLI